MQDTIACPGCGCEITISETLAAQIRSQLRKEFDADARRKDTALAIRQKDLQKRESLVEASRRCIEQEVAGRLAQEQARLAQEAEDKVRATVALEFSDLREQLTDAGQRIAETQKAELQMRKDRRRLEEEKAALELTVNRTLDEERAKIRAEAKQEADNQHRLQQADKDKVVDDLRHQISELKRKSEQGVPYAQGEVMELHLEDSMRERFPHDTIEAVPVGAHGGDILQRVHDPSGLDCGIILWESKRTKKWSDAWLPKLRNDQRLSKAHVAVLTSEELPKGLMTFSFIDGVWVTSRQCLMGLAAALRHGMIEAARTRRSLQGQQTKVQVLYNYLASSEFRQRIEGIVEAFMTLRDDLESEKRSMHRIWSKREKQLERAAMNTAGLYGDLAGIVGPSLPQIANLDLAVIAQDDQAIDSETLELDAAAAGLNNSTF